eukprot:scaffold9794_cov18-Tisochrysis_lutea.AAC.1
MLCYTTVWCLHGPWARLKHHAVSCIPNQRASMEAPDQLRRGPFLWTGASLAAWGGALGASLKFLAPEFLPRACSGLTSCAHAAPGPEKQTLAGMLDMCAPYLGKHPDKAPFNRGNNCTEKAGSSHIQVAICTFILQQLHAVPVVAP